MATSKMDPIGQALNRGLDEIFRERQDAFSDSAEIQVMTRALLEHETRRIEAKLGAGHPRTRQLQARLDAARTQINSLVAERARHAIRVPEVADQDALIHGRVVDNDGRGITNLMVCLTDQNANPIRVAGEPTTDDTGYFAFTLMPDLIKRLREEFEGGVFLAVFSADGATRIHRQPKPLALSNGVRLVAEIQLSRGPLLGVGPVTPPPPEPDQVVVPDLIGQPEEEAVARLERLQLKLGERKTQPVEEQVGNVLDQDPKAESVVPAGSSVVLVIGVSAMVQVPQLVGLKVATARRKIRTSSLTIGDIEERESDEPEVVMEQDPKPEAQVSPATKVNLVVGQAQPEQE